MKKRICALLTACFLLIGTGVGAGAVDGAYVYAATHHGAVVDVRLIAPEGGILLLGVYGRADRQMHNMAAQAVTASPSTQVVTVTFETAPASTEYVRAFLVEADTYRPLTVGVLADVVIPSTPSTPTTPETPEEPDTTEEPESPAVPETPAERQYTYVLNTNSKVFHYENCSAAKRISSKNRQEFYGTRSQAEAMGYRACKICSP